MEILSNSVFHGETIFKSDVTFEESEIHMSSVQFNGLVDFSKRTCVYFNNGISGGKAHFSFPDYSGLQTLATTTDLANLSNTVDNKVDQFIISVPAVAADCSIFKLVNQGHGGDIPLSIQMFKKDTTICSLSSNGFWTPVQADLYTDRSMGLCEIIVKKSSSFEIESGSYEIRATYYHP